MKTKSWLGIHTQITSRPGADINCKTGLFITQYLEIVDLSAEPSYGGRIPLYVVTVLKFLQGGLQRVSWIWT